MIMTAQATAQSALFIEESRQLLHKIEQGWQQARPDDGQWRSQMLRQLHQLKGMALSFDEAAAADCCHQLETQLNQQTERLSPAQAVVVSQTLGTLHELLHSLKHVAKIPTINLPAKPETVAQQVWQIDFKPLPGFFANGQDPLQYLKQLQQLGEMSVQADTAKLPEFADFDASQPYLSWQITLKTDVDVQTLWQVFDWVKDVCALTITPITKEPFPTGKNAAIQTPATLQQPLRAIMKRHQQQTAWLDELQQAAALLPLPLKSRLDQLQLAQSQNYLAMQKLMLKPMTVAYQRLPSLLQTICKQTGKQAELTLPEETLWLPAPVLEFVSDVLIQLLRNAVAHGIESPEMRLTAGKPPLGKIVIQHALQNMQLKLEFYDDGGGLQTEKIIAAAGGKNDTAIDELIFQAGLSTANGPDLLSGRGIGLDLVRQHIGQLQGQVSVKSEKGQCCVFKISIPLSQTMQVLQPVVVADQLYVMSPNSIIDDLPAANQTLRHVNGRGEFVAYQQQWLPVWDIRQRFKLSGSTPEEARLVIIGDLQQLQVLRVDALLPAAEYLLSNAQRHYRSIPGVLALATDGRSQPALWLQWQTIFGERR